MTQSITKNSKKGFTLVELVVVIAILAILAAIAIPVVNSIINTASKNGALSNAETIELAIKECQADIAAHQTDVYNGTATYTKADGTNGGPVPSAATGHATISVEHVAGVKAINDAFDQVTYNGNDYRAFWDTGADKCVFLAVTTNNGVVANEAIDATTHGAYAGATTPLTVAGAAGTPADGHQVPDSSIFVDSL